MGKLGMIGLISTDLLHRFLLGCSRASRALDELRIHNYVVPTAYSLKFGELESNEVQQMRPQWWKQLLSRVAGAFKILKSVASEIAVVLLDRPHGDNTRQLFRQEYVLADDTLR